MFIIYILFTIFCFIIIVAAFILFVKSSIRKVKCFIADYKAGKFKSAVKVQGELIKCSKKEKKLLS